MRVARTLALALIAAAILAPTTAFADMILAPPSPAPSPTVDSTGPAASSAESEAPPARRLYSSKRRALTWEGLFGSMPTLLSMMLIPLVFTVVIETPVVATVGHGSTRSWLVGLLVNTLTNPIAAFTVLVSWPLVFWSSSWLGWVVIGAVEIGVVVAEAFVFRRLLDWSGRKSLLTSVIANSASFGLGLVFYFGV